MTKKVLFRKKSILLLGCGLVSVGIGVFIWWARQPSKGTIIENPSRQPRNNEPFQASEISTKVETDCLTFELPFPVKYPKHEVRENGCVFRAGLVNKPGLLSVSISTKSAEYSLDQDPSVLLREKEATTYTSFASVSSSQSLIQDANTQSSESKSQEIRGFKAEKEVVVFIWQKSSDETQSRVITLSLYELARVDETIEQWMDQLVEAVLSTE